MIVRVVMQVFALTYLGLGSKSEHLLGEWFLLLFPAAYLDNPNNYALEKGEAYYKSLGYKSLMDGVIGEAEKEGRGEEVRARIEAFKKKSQLKGLAVIFGFFGFMFFLRLTNPYVPPGSM